MREFTCPSGAILKVAPAPFADSKALYQALLKEGAGLKFSKGDGIESVIKDMFCISFSSAEIEKTLMACMKRCLYNGSKVDENSFESIEARQDYVSICMEVGTENVRPFVKGLFAQFEIILAMIANSHASK